MHVFVYICLYLYTFVCICIHLFVFVYICLYNCLYTFAFSTFTALKGSKSLMVSGRTVAKGVKEVMKQTYQGIRC